MFEQEIQQLSDELAASIPSILAKASQIIGRDVRGGAAGCSQSDGKAAGQIEEHFRHEIAGIADGPVAVSFPLLDEVVIRLLKELLKKDEMFKVFQQITP